MKNFLVATITCPDRTGIVERITATLVEFSANWEESRMARLGGQFAGVVKISVPDARTQALVEALHALSDEHMTIVVRATAPVSQELPAGFTMYALRLAGGDHEGIVHTVAAYLVERGINVESMETEVIPAPITAAPLFHMQAVIRVPVDVAREELQANLHQIGDELGVDIEIFPQEISSDRAP
jgi:glycine cleavage system regulatory protein